MASSDAMNATDEQSPAQIGQFLTSSRHDDGTQEAIDLNTFQLQPQTSQSDERISESSHEVQGHRRDTSWASYGS